MAESGSSHLTSGRLLAKNTLWNLVGTGAAALAAVFVIPILIRGIGLDRFGVLTIAWMLIGYFGLFDLGLGVTLTKMVSDQFGAGRQDDIPPLVWTSLAMMLALALLGACVLFALTPLLVNSTLKIPSALVGESLTAVHLLALALPFTITTSGLRGLLEAQQRFDVVNAVRIPMGLCTFLGPLLVLPFSATLPWMVAVLVLVRLLAWLAYLTACLRTLPQLRAHINFHRDLIKPVLRFGSWMTVSNIISPAMVYIDRFLIGALVSVAAVAYYATPFEVVSKLMVIPSALCGVLFPAFAVSYVQDRKRTALLLVRGIKYVSLAVFPIILLAVTLAHDGLHLWLGAEFARHSATVLRWLAVGIWVNSLALIPAALVQAAGRPDLTARLHMIELPLYLTALWFAVRGYGIEGAAIAWVGRVVLDAVLLFLITRHLVPEAAPLMRRMLLATAAALVLFYAATLPVTLAAKAIFLTAVLLATALSTWFLFLAPDERGLMLLASRALSVRAGSQ